MEAKWLAQLYHQNVATSPWLRLQDSFGMLRGHGKTKQPTSSTFPWSRSVRRVRSKNVVAEAVDGRLQVREDEDAATQGPRQFSAKALISERNPALACCRLRESAGHVSGRLRVRLADGHGCLVDSSPSLFVAALTDTFLDIWSAAPPPLLALTRHN